MHVDALLQVAPPEARPTLRAWLAEQGLESESALAGGAAGAGCSDGGGLDADDASAPKPTGLAARLLAESAAWVPASAWRARGALGGALVAGAVALALAVRTAWGPVQAL
jgi:hypothetical protein